MQRFLKSKPLRNALWTAANGKCRLCGCDLPEDWHADHIEPWSKTGDTNVHEMQALCPTCNLKKGNRTMGDRRFQVELDSRMARVGAEDFPIKILAWIVPGGGKSRLPGIIARRFPNHRIGWFVPRLSLQSQACGDLKEHFGIEVRDSGNDVDPCRGKRGFVATHQSLSMSPQIWVDEFRKHPYIAVFDEPHHAKEFLSSGPNPLAAAFARIKADITLFMSGTLETNDRSLIHGMEYEQTHDGYVIRPERSADIYIRYTRKTALDEKAVCPIEFFRHDGPVKWFDPSEKKERDDRLSEAKGDRESAAIFTALRTEVASQLFGSGVKHWKEHAKGCKLLIVADSQSNARLYADKLLRDYGVRCALAITENDEAQLEIKKFKKDIQALSTCAMAYEGLNVPLISHIICLTHIRSVPWIEQMFARAWRWIDGKPNCYAFVPDDRRMNRVIERIYSEQPGVVGLPGGDGPDGPPSDRKNILAKEGFVDAIHRQLLDGVFVQEEWREMIISQVSKLGLTGHEPEVLALVDLIRRKQIPQANQFTVKEQEQNIRKQIHEQANSMDADLAKRNGRDKPEFGETLKRLFRITNKSITEMSIEELQDAYAKLQTFRS